MYEDVNNASVANQWYDRAVEWAYRSQNTDVLASALSMKSHSAWIERDSARAIDLAEASLRIPGTSAAVRALASQQLARGFALAGDSENTERMLDEAEKLTAVAAENPEAQPPWVYFHSTAGLQMQRAIAYTDLGKGAEAARLLVAGLAQMDGGFKRDRGRRTAQLALAYAAAGEVAAGASSAVEAARYAVETGSSQTVTSIRRTCRVLRSRWPDHPAVREMDDALKTLQLSAS